MVHDIIVYERFNVFED